MYYSEQYYDKVASKTRLRLISVLGLTVLIIAAMAVCCALRLKYVNWIVAGLGFIIVFFIWNMKLTPWLRYNKFMKEMRHGQKRSLEVTFVSATPETRFYDGVEVHDFLTRVGDREEDERVYVFDADKELPKLSCGQKIKVTSFGTFVVDIEEC